MRHILLAVPSGHVRLHCGCVIVPDFESATHLRGVGDPCAVIIAHEHDLGLSGNGREIWKIRAAASLVPECQYLLAEAWTQRRFRDVERRGIAKCGEEVSADTLRIV